MQHEMILGVGGSIISRAWARRVFNLKTGANQKHDSFLSIPLHFEKRTVGEQTLTLPSFKLRVYIFGGDTLIHEGLAWEFRGVRNELSRREEGGSPRCSAVGDGKNPSGRTSAALPSSPPVLGREPRACCPDARKTSVRENAPTALELHMKCPGHISSRCGPGPRPLKGQSRLCLCPGRGIPGPWYNTSARAGRVRSFGSWGNDSCSHCLN